MIFDLLQFTCTIYRLQGVTGYDYTGSLDGEIVEDWRIVTQNQPCRYNPAEDPYRRRSDGIVDIGKRSFFFPPDASVQNADRLETTDQEGTHYYHVRHSHFIRDWNNLLHHIEVDAEIIDWVAPTYITQWTPMS